MYFNRWIVFVACVFLQTSAGLNYSFSVFAPALKVIFHLDEVQLGTVATLGFNLGGKSRRHARHPCLFIRIAMHGGRHGARSARGRVHVGAHHTCSTFSTCKLPHQSQ